MTRPPKDDEREERIHMEIVVDAYDSAIARYATHIIIQITPSE